MKRFEIPTRKDIADGQERLQTQRTNLFKAHKENNDSMEKDPEPLAVSSSQASSSATAAGRPSPFPQRLLLPSEASQQTPPQQESQRGPLREPQREPSREPPPPPPTQPTTLLSAVTVPPPPRTSSPLTTVTSTGNTIIVNRTQEANPVLKHIRNVRWEWGAIVPDFAVGAASCALFLSLKYHRLYPAYIRDRIAQLKQDFNLRLLLLLVDVDDPSKTLDELNVLCIQTKFTLVLGWSNEEIGRYLETYKMYENRPADAIKGRTNNDFVSVMTDVLTTIKSVNKTDVVTLLSQFGSLQSIMNASKDDLALCPGFGEQKAKRLHDSFREPFVADKQRRLDHERRAQQQAMASSSAQGASSFGPTSELD